MLCNEMEKEVNLILDILEKGPQFKKEQALKRLVEISEDGHVDVYRKYITDKDWHLRLSAAWGLGKILKKEAWVELTPLLQDRAYGVREDVKKIIEQYCKEQG